MTDPESAGPITITPTANERMEILSAHFTYTADANAGDRICEVFLNYQATSARIGVAPIVQVANDVFEYQIIAGASNFVDPTGAECIIGIPQRLVIPVGGTMTIDFRGKKIGDDIAPAGLVYLYYKELP